MPQYLLAVWHDDDYADLDFSSADMQRLVSQVGALNAEMEQSGAGEPGRTYQRDL